MQDMGLLPPGDDLVSLGWEELERAVASQRDKVAGVGEEAKQRLSGARVARRPAPHPDPPFPPGPTTPSLRRGPSGPEAMRTQRGRVHAMATQPVAARWYCAPAGKSRRGSTPYSRFVSDSWESAKAALGPGAQPHDILAHVSGGGEGAPDEGLLLLRALHLAQQLAAQTVCAAGAAVTVGALPVAQCCGATFRPTRSGAWRRHLLRRCERARACRCDCCSEGCIGLVDCVYPASTLYVRATVSTCKLRLGTLGAACLPPATNVHAMLRSAGAPGSGWPRLPRAQIGSPQTTPRTRRHDAFGMAGRRGGAR